MHTKGIIYSFLFLLAACNNQEETPAGGPCTYRNTVLPAKLIQLISSDSLNYDAAFAISRSSGKTDTVYYQQLHHRLLSTEEIKKDSLQVGQTYQYLQQDLVTGSCNPHVVTIQFKKN
jgi:hypothetical protein